MLHAGDTASDRYVRIKVCGLTRSDEALACLDAGADWIGLNFHPRSSRFVDRGRAEEIIAAIANPARVVGVFVNRPPGEIVREAAELGLEIIQLHGDEPPEDLPRLYPLRVIRAFRLGGPADVPAMLAYLDRARVLGRPPDAVLVDASVPGQAGGTGTVLAEELLDLLPPLSRLILAGGLNPGNVAGKVKQVRPWMVDVASGVESGPGRKDPARVAAFVVAVRQARRSAAVDNPHPAR